MATQLYNLEYEKQFLSAVIRNPAILADCAHINDHDFSDTNRVVFQTIRACLSSMGVGSFSRFILVERLKTLNLKIAGTVDPEVYVEALERIGINDKAAIEVSRQILKWSIRRRLNATARLMLEITEDKKATERPAAELLAELTQAFNREVNLLEGSKEHQPIDMFGTIRGFLDIDNSFSSRAIASPWPIFNDLWGYFDRDSVTLLASRMKIGKSSFWLSMGLQLAQQDEDDSLRILVLDTELSVAENQSRVLSSVSGVKEFYIRQGWYKNHRENRAKVEAAAALIEPLTKRVDHIYCGGMDLEVIDSIARRWAHKTLTAGKRGLIVYDYIKLNSSADFGSKNPLFIQIGAKMDTMKRLSKDLQIPVICFAQTNRENVDTKEGGRMHNSAVIGGSDMLAQFASNIYLLDELSPEERAALGLLNPDSPTHSLREIACRQRGPCEMGEHGLVKYKDERGKDRYTRNYLLYRFDQFHVTEWGSLRTAIARNKTVIDVQGEKPADKAASKPAEKLL